MRSEESRTTWLLTLVLWPPCFSQVTLIVLMVSTGTHSSTHTTRVTSLAREVQGSIVRLIRLDAAELLDHEPLAGAAAV